MDETLKLKAELHIVKANYNSVYATLSKIQSELAQHKAVIKILADKLGCSDEIQALLGSGSYIRSSPGGSTIITSTSASSTPTSPTVTSATIGPLSTSSLSSSPRGTTPSVSSAREPLQGTASQREVSSPRRATTAVVPSPSSPSTSTWARTSATANGHASSPRLSHATSGSNLSATVSSVPSTSPSTSSSNLSSLSVSSEITCEEENSPPSKSPSNSYVSITASQNVPICSCDCTCSAGGTCTCTCPIGCSCCFELTSSSFAPTSTTPLAPIDFNAPAPTETKKGMVHNNSTRNLLRNTRAALSSSPNIFRNSASALEKPVNMIMSSMSSIGPGKEGDPRKRGDSFGAVFNILSGFTSSAAQTAAKGRNVTELKSVKATQEFRKKQPLLDYCIIQSLNKGNIETKYIYPPQEGKGTSPILASVSQFCFPDKDQFTNQRTYEFQGQPFSFALTSDDGYRRLGYCRRFNDGMVPLCFCIISVFQSTSIFQKILEKVVELWDSVEGAESVNGLLKKLEGKIFPFLGESISIAVKSPFTGKQDIVQLSYTANIQLDGTDLRSLMGNLSPNNLLTVLISLICERRIIFYSSSVTTLSGAVQAVVDFISPLSWQHIYIPVLPPSLISYCCAPMPFVIGVLSQNIDEVNKLPMDEVLMVNLDKDELFGINDFNLLHPSVRNPLLSALKTFQGAIKKAKPTHLMDPKDKESLNSKKKKMFDVFTDFFVALLAFYKDFFLEDGNFNKDSFVADRNPEMKEFCFLVAMSQMFERFVEERKTKPYVDDFEKKLMVYEKGYVEHVEKKKSFSPTFKFLAK
eukprot:TRINITY_DN2223_c0_g1_i3.p1 TRINITY_DN2223_c0_g1~~TRINITY_DN2223_c0_g1_i3.p1  ORF type:complete len:809 (+),score=148.05 TRINITY_DN2223_c0_g1_i3:229-2655(+)